MSVYASSSTQQPAAICALKSPADAIHVLEAVRLGLVPRVTRRLTGHERSMIRPGTVWVWEEEETNMRRWTDGRRWGASRVGGGGFLVYTESSDSHSPPPRNDTPHHAYPHYTGEGPDYYSSGIKKPESLVKQTYSTTMTHPVTGKVKKFHVVAYSSKHNPQGDAHNPLPLPHQLPLLSTLKIPGGIWPEWEHRREEATTSRRQSTVPPQAQSTPVTAYPSPDGLSNPMPAGNTYAHHSPADREPHPPVPQYAHRSPPNQYADPRQMSGPYTPPFYPQSNRNDQPYPPRHMSQPPNYPMQHPQPTNGRNDRYHPYYGARPNQSVSPYPSPVGNSPMAPPIQNHLMNHPDYREQPQQSPSQRYPHPLHNTGSPYTQPAGGMYPPPLPGHDTHMEQPVSYKQSPDGVLPDTLDQADPRRIPSGPPAVQRQVSDSARVQPVGVDSSLTSESRSPKMSIGSALLNTDGNGAHGPTTLPPLRLDGEQEEEKRTGQDVAAESSPPELVHA